MYKQEILSFSDAFDLTEEGLRDTLANEKNWESRYRKIMLMGKALPPLPDEMKTQDALVQGCESKVWLHACWQESKLKLALSSDAKIVRGLLAIVASVCTNKSKQEIDAIDIEHVFSELGLLHHLSPSRVNGIHAIIVQIKQL